MPEADARQSPSVSIVVPTYHEAENLPELIRRVGVLRDTGLELELLIMDDNSNDGTAELVARDALPWVRLIIRQTNRGLSAAVMQGFTLARNDIIVVMDADLSHPPESIPQMVDALTGGADFVVGSRYVAGGSTARDWGLLRWWNSRIATLLARPFTKLRDPMSGFFAFRREALDTCAPLNPIGYKIGLELIVKGRFRHVAEVPIHFSERAHGESKLTMREQWRYARHLRRLAEFKYGEFAHFGLFAAVGVTGVAVNLVVLTLLWEAGVRAGIAVPVAIGISLLSNFALNRYVTFSYARDGNPWVQLAGFAAACSIGALVNAGVALTLIKRFDVFAEWPQLASLVGIVAGLAFNYLSSRFVVFPKTPDD